MASSQTADTIIIGAGPAGLGAALALGRHATVLEAGADVAGLCRTIVLDGAVFDLGGHSFHTPHPEVRELVFGALKMEEQRRNAWCWLRGEWIKYPFQKHVESLQDLALRETCINGMMEAAGGFADNFDTHLVRHFGLGVADVFMRPYNRKLWGEDLTRLTTDWTGERVPGKAGMAEHFVSEGGKRMPLQADTSIAYPARGGFGEIFRALARRVTDLRLGTSVRRINPLCRELETSGGEIFRWGKLVSTLPLPALLKILPGVPADLAAAATLLETIPIDLVMVVLEGRGPVSRQRVYCPEPFIAGHKMVFNHTSSTWLRDLPRHGIQVEVAGNRRNMSVLLGDEVVASLVTLGLLTRPADVRRVEIVHLEHGYPVPNHARDRVIKDARAWLEPQNIYLAGRFAEWAYINADEALHRGLQLGRALSAGASL